jgi:hypothetical protein
VSPGCRQLEGGYMPRKVISDAELAMLPGYRADPQGRGHYFQSPTGLCLMSGAMPADECHEHGRWGIINISRCEDIIARSKVAAQRVPINDGLKNSISEYDIDQAWVDNMSIQRRNEPIIFVVAGDGAHVIDGTHRLQRRIQDGCKDVRGHFMQPDILRAMRVRLMRQQPDGSWKQDGGLSDEDLDREILAGKAKVKESFRPA